MPSIQKKNPEFEFNSPQKMNVFVTVGTHPQQFNRLLRKVDELVAKKKLTGLVFAQTGASDYIPKNYAFEKYLDLDAFEKKIAGADLVISHGGEGNIGLALKYKKKCIAMPRLYRFGEHTNDHQTELVEAAAKAQKILAAWSESELEKQVLKIDAFEPYFEQGPKKIIALLEDFFKERV